MKSKCIVCNKREREDDSLFCEPCSEKDILIKINAFRKSKEFMFGIQKHFRGNNYGRLPTKEMRERNTS